MMSKLSDSQLILLSCAAQHEDGILEDAGAMNAGAAAKVVAALTRKRLLREIRSKPGMSIWRQDDRGRTWSLVITKAGKKAIGVEDEPAPEPASSSPVQALHEQRDARIAKPSTVTASLRASESNPAATDSERDDSPGSELPPNRAGNAGNARSNNPPKLRPGSKLAAIVDLMLQADGTSIAAMMETTGWLPHTTRAALTGLRKRGFVIVKENRDGSGTVYRIVEQSSPHSDASASDRTTDLAAVA
ncbi:MAG: DUF3489 domain-containing protein [Beijerinckiaceae bacterium]